MSREVEVQNIQMTATTPEDTQISLGTIGSTASAASTAETYMLAGSTGILVNTNGVVSAPRVDHDVTGYTTSTQDDLDWSNIADISKYYQFGRLIPASSTDGANVYFTPDAAGVGRTLKPGAGFYQAAAATSEYKYDSTNKTYATGGAGDSAKATAHIDTVSGGNDTWMAAEGGTYEVSTGWTETNDDGYYIDIPVWLRTSSTQTGGTPIYVTGYVTDKTEESNEDTGDLYQVVRVAILTDAGAASQGCLTLANGKDEYINPVSGQVEHYSKFPTSSSAANILDSANYNGRKGGDADTKIYAVNSATITPDNTTGMGEPGHGEITQNNGTAAVATLAAGTGKTYGNPTKLIIRVWLEGEDGNCWNENAGQDWNIALKFSKDPLA
ncbi:MAG: hypothetical protein VZR53_08445 [Prevotella sp.]|nr:hypothetical protein [Prevotella sp.]